MRKQLALCIALVATFASVGFAAGVGFVENWEDDTVGSPPGSPWYMDPHMTDGSLSITADVDRYLTPGKGLLVNDASFNGKNVGYQAMLVPGGQEVEATDAAKVTVGYWVQSPVTKQAEMYLEISLGDVHAPRLADVGTYNPLPDPIPVLAYCKPLQDIAVTSKATFYFDGRQWIPHGFLDNDGAWHNPRMTVGLNMVHLICSCNNNPADVPRQYLGRFDRVSIYTLDAVYPTSTVLDDLSIVGGNVVHNLGVTPNGGLASVGLVGGPFTPQCKTYTLANTGTSSLDWTATKSQDWLSATPPSGALTPGGSVDVDVCINANANGLPRGTYADQVAFTNTTGGDVQTRDVELLAKPVDIFDFDVDGDVDLSDFGYLQSCLTGPEVLVGGPPCAYADLDLDGHVDGVDVQMFRACLSGSGVPPLPGCLTPAP